MAHVVVNTIAGSDRERVEGEVLSALDAVPGSDVWLISIRAVADGAAALVSVESGEQVLGSWTFARLDEIRPQIREAFSQAPFRPEPAAALR